MIISIHAPRAGSDRIEIKDRKTGRISIHAPRAGSDTPEVRVMPSRLAFQSTLPVRGATQDDRDIAGAKLFQSTLPVRGATLTRRDIEIGRLKFQSTLPVRGATLHLFPVPRGLRISIHAPRAGSDLIAAHGQRDLVLHFNPRSPCGERQLFPVFPHQTVGFQSTLPVRGATAKMPKTEPFILSNFHNFKKYTDRTRTKVIIKMELWINLSPFSGANRTGNLWSLLLRTLKGS